MKKLDHPTFLTLFGLFYPSLIYLLVRPSWIISRSFFFIKLNMKDKWLKIIITKYIFEVNNF